MWIRSQDKMVLKKVDDVRLAEVKHYENGEEYFPIVWGGWEMYPDRCLGKYSTKEKALKVLDKIVRLINDFVGIDGVNIPVFHMPQDSEV